MTVIDGWDLPAPLGSISFKGPFLRPESFGAKGDGVTDDTVPVQNMTTFAGTAFGSGTFLLSALYLISSAITEPSRGTYLYLGIGVATSQGDNQDPYPTVRPGFIVPNNGLNGTGHLGNQPTPYGNSNNSALAEYLFDCSNATAHSGQGELSIGFSNLLVNVAFPTNYFKPLCLLATTNTVRSVLIDSCEMWSLGLTYMGSQGVGGVQMDRFLVRDSHLAGGWIWGDGTAPFIGVVYDCFIAASVESLYPFTHGQFIEQNAFWTWFVHHNVFNTGTGGNPLTHQRAWLYAFTISQTNLGNITHNTFYAADGGCIYWQDNNAYNVNDTGDDGIVIDGNQFNHWNLSGIGGISAAAVYIDHSTAGTPSQLVTIGTNVYQGNAGATTPTTTYGIFTVDDPYAAHLSISGVTNNGNPGIFRAIITAPFHLNGVNYGNAGAGALQYTFDGKASYSGNATLNTTDRVVEGTGGAGGITLTAATGLVAGAGNTSVVVTKVDGGAGAVTIAGIAGANIVLAAQWASQRLTWDGTQWLRA